MATTPTKRSSNASRCSRSCCSTTRPRGSGVESLGSGEVDGVATLDLKLTFPDDSTETWHLDAESFLEVAIDSQIVDHTQAGEPMSQRAFFDDFREVESLTLPHQVELEFGARLESMTIARIDVDPVLDDASFSPPAPDSKQP